MFCLLTSVLIWGLNYPQENSGLSKKNNKMHIERLMPFKIYYTSVVMKNNRLSYEGKLVWKWDFVKEWQHFVLTGVLVGG